MKNTGELLQQPDQYEVDDNPNNQTKDNDNIVERTESNSEPLVNTRTSLSSSSIPNSRSEITLPRDNSTGRIITIERFDTEENYRSKPEAIELFIPQRDIGEEAVVVWDAALVLAYYLEKHQNDLGLSKSNRGCAPLHVVDVGAGTGAVGLTAAALGANVTLTDLDRFIPLLEEGISANCNLFGTCEPTSDPKFRFIRALPLNWGNAADIRNICKKSDNGVGGPPDLIVVSDCVYYEASIAPLIFTLRELASSGKHSVPILLSYEVRDYSPEKKRVKEAFFALAQRYFTIKEVPTEDCHSEYSSDDIKVIKMLLLPAKDKE